MAKNRILSNNVNHAFAIEDCITNERTLSKLFSQRTKFLKNFHEIEHTSNRKFIFCNLLYKVVTFIYFILDEMKRIPKLLDSSPSALRRLSKKGELLGVNNKRRTNFIGLDDLSDIRRKWHIQPAFSVEFINYYIGKCSIELICLKY